MLYICIFSNKFDLKQTIHVLHSAVEMVLELYSKYFIFFVTHK